MAPVRNLMMLLVACSAVAGQAKNSSNGNGKKPTEGEVAVKGKRGRGIGFSKSAIRYCMDEDDTGKCTGRQVRLKLARLEQRDASGKLVRKAHGFGKLEASWSTPEQVTLYENGSALAPQMEGGVNATKFYFNVDDLAYGKNKDNLSANFTFIGYMIESNGTVYNSNQSIPVDEGQFKFDIKVSNWSMGVNDTLTAGLFMHMKDKSGKNKTAASDGKVDTNSTSKIKKMDLGDGMFMENPETALVDGVQKDIDVSIGVTNSTVEMTWKFPSFNDSVHYDPVLGVDAGNSAVALSTSISAQLLFGIVMFWVASM